MKANRRIDEKSPCLLQHARNPVERHAWNMAAFEDEEAARHLNGTFISIKVDREERPDIVAVYMAACHMMIGSGGWPLTIFMTPDKKPFFGTLDRQPSAFTFFLCGLDFALRPGQDIVIAGESGSPDAERLVSTLNLRFAPNLVAQLKSGDNAARPARFAGYTDGLQLVQGKSAAHLCVGSACTESVTDPQALIERILGKPHAPR
jgi:uncharacterized protein YyaL (SSP411 family)